MISLESETFVSQGHSFTAGIQEEKRAIQALCRMEHRNEKLERDWQEGKETQFFNAAY